MKQILITILILMISILGLKAQDWETITGFNQLINDLEVFENKLFIGGGFTKNDDNTCYWSAYYDGNTVKRHTELIGGGGLRGLAVFNNDLYGVGALKHGGASGVSKWTGNTWTNGGGTTYSHSVIYTDETDLYVCSDDGKIRKKTGNSNFETFYDLGEEEITNIIRYKNQLIFTGSFTEIGGITAQNIATYDGQNWSSLGSGIEGKVRAIEVYKDELYVAGEVDVAGGLEVNMIAKWNGSVWSDVGGGATNNTWWSNGIRDLNVYDNQLIVVGDFDKVGGVEANDVAAWNGSQWTGMSLEHPSSFVNCIEVYNNELYVGTFDFDNSYIYKFLGVISSIEEVGLNKMNIYPNPTSEKAFIDLKGFKETNIEVSVMDIFGKEIYSIKLPSIEGQVVFDTTELSNGTYFVHLNDPKTQNLLQKSKLVVCH